LEVTAWEVDATPMIWVVRFEKVSVRLALTKISRPYFLIFLSDFTFGDDDFDCNTTNERKILGKLVWSVFMILQ